MNGHGGSFQRNNPNLDGGSFCYTTSFSVAQVPEDSTVVLLAVLTITPRACLRCGAKLLVREERHAVTATLPSGYVELRHGVGMLKSKRSTASSRAAMAGHPQDEAISTLKRSQFLGRYQLSVTRNTRIGLAVMQAKYGIAPLPLYLDGSRSETTRGFRLRPTKHRWHIALRPMTASTVNGHWSAYRGGPLSVCSAARKSSTP